MTKRPLQPQDKFCLRLPTGMRGLLKLAAQRNQRSINQEIICAIKSYLASGTAPIEGTEAYGRPARKSDQYMVRLPDKMRDAIKLLSNASRRSMNSEIVRAIEMHLSSEPISNVEPMARDDLHFRLRLPEDLKAAISEHARGNAHSLTAEIVHRLRLSFEPPVPQRSATALDIVWEVSEISKLIGRNERETFHLLSTGQIPGKKVGGRWVVDRAVLINFFKIT